MPWWIPLFYGAEKRGRVTKNFYGWNNQTLCENWKSCQTESWILSARNGCGWHIFRRFLLPSLLKNWAACLTKAATFRQEFLPVSSSPAGWGIACWLICSRAPVPGSAWCKWLGWPGWSTCRAKGRWRRLPLTPARGGWEGAAGADGPIERGRGKGRESRSAWGCAWHLGHDPAL